MPARARWPGGQSPGGCGEAVVLLESPVRESALVYANGQLAGSVWHPFNQLSTSQAVHRQNHLRIAVVANLTINELAGYALPDYRLLKLGYRQRFVPSGYKHLRALPARHSSPGEHSVTETPRPGSYG